MIFVCLPFCFFLFYQATNESIYWGIGRGSFGGGFSRVISTLIDDLLYICPSIATGCNIHDSLCYLLVLFLYFSSISTPVIDICFGFSHSLCVVELTG